MVVEIAAPFHTAQMKVWTALGGGNSGIKGNKLHTYGFHRGAAFVPASDYSRRHDPKGADGPYAHWGWCCAGDYHHGGKAALRARHVVLLTRLLDGDPDLDDVCEFIGQPWANRPVLYWARWDGVRKLVRYTGKGHTDWSHVAVFRSRGASAGQLWTPATAAAGGPSKTKPTTLKAPAWRKRTPNFVRASPTAKYDASVRSWQARMRQRGWLIKVDGFYGESSAVVCRKFQADKRLGVDGLLGPATFAAAWTLPVT